MEIQLLNLQAGKKAKIKRLEGGFEFQAKLASLNIRIGKIIKIVAAQPFRGPIVVEINDRRATLGRGIATRIFVEEENEISKK